MTGSIDNLHHIPQVGSTSGSSKQYTSQNGIVDFGTTPSAHANHKKITDDAKTLSESEKSPSVLRSVAGNIVEPVAVLTAEFAVVTNGLVGFAQVTTVGLTALPGYIGGALVSPLTLGASLLIRSIKKGKVDTDVLEGAKKDAVKTIKVSGALTSAVPAYVAMIGGALVKSITSVIPYLLLKAHVAITGEPEGLVWVFIEGLKRDTAEVRLLLDDPEKVDMKKLESWSVKLILKPLQIAYDEFNKPSQGKSS